MATVERFETVHVYDEGPAQVRSHVVLRTGGEALCGTPRQEAVNGAGLVGGNCVQCYTALDLYRAVLGTEAAL